MLIESIIIHGRITVPTEDFLTLTALVDVLGQSAIIELLEAGVLDFVRVTGALAYVGGGGGIVHINFPYSGKEPSAIGAELPVAVDWALSMLNVKTNPTLPRLVIARTKQVDLLALSKGIAERSYEDFGRFAYESVLDPKNLPGLSARHVRVFGGQASHHVGDPVTRLLSIATANLELDLMAQTGSADADTSTPVGHALRARAMELGLSGEKFSVLKEVADVPDIGEAILEGRVDITTLIKLHQSAAGSAFREWFHEHCSSDPVVTSKAYVELLREVPALQSTPAKVLRFIITNVLGFIPVVGPIIGVAAAGVDSFVVDKIAEYRGPKFFIENLQQIEKSGDA